MKTRWTIVQHSRFGYLDDRTFERSLEPRKVQLSEDERRVKKVGGLLFDDFNEAAEFVQNEDVESPGTFSSQGIDGLSIYVPKRK